MIGLKYFNSIVRLYYNSRSKITQIELIFVSLEENYKFKCYGNTLYQNIYWKLYSCAAYY